MQMKIPKIQDISGDSNMKLQGRKDRMDWVLTM